MLNMQIVENFRTFEIDNEGRDKYSTDYTCDVCDKPSEVYIEISHLMICKTCLDKAQQLWNKAFLDDARKGRK
jgi:hypothetical protein